MKNNNGIKSTEYIDMVISPHELKQIQRMMKESHKESGSRLVVLHMPLIKVDNEQTRMVSFHRNITTKELIQLEQQERDTETQSVSKEVN